MRQVEVRSNIRKKHEYDIKDCGYSSPCWVWCKSASSGYGQVRVNGKLYKAHRFYYEMEVGPIPEGKHIDHLCRNPLCVNPEHMEVVTLKENTRRGRSAKLNVDDVISIRRRYSNGESISDLHKEFGISRSHAYRIINNERWEEVDCNA